MRPGRVSQIAHANPHKALATVNGHPASGWPDVGDGPCQTIRSTARHLTTRGRPRKLSPSTWTTPNVPIDVTAGERSRSPPPIIRGRHPSTRRFGTHANAGRTATRIACGIATALRAAGQCDSTPRRRPPAALARRLPTPRAGSFVVAPEGAARHQNVGRNAVACVLSFRRN